jgi:hypothetical protein
MKTKQAHGSTKHGQIDRSQSMMVVAAAVAAFVLVFMLVGAKSLVNQISYQNRVISTKKKAVDTLRSNVQATQDLTTSYKAFASTTQNVLGGNPQGTGPQDGDNAKIVLDALPSKYDFPALTTSLEKLITSQNMQIENITGNDDEVAQTDQASPKPEAVAMPFQASASGSYDSVRGLINVFGASIRPFQLQKIQLTGAQAKMTVKIEAQTFYQPVKNFDVTKKVVK